MIAHSLFGFDMFFLIKGYKRLKYWWDKFNTDKLRKYRWRS